MKFNYMIGSKDQIRTWMNQMQYYEKNENRKWYWIGGIGEEYVEFSTWIRDTIDSRLLNKK